MKHLSLILLPLALMLIVSCGQDDYLVDGGLSKPDVNMSTMEFIESHDQLDTLAILIQRAGLTGEVNGESTLFAPNNLSIHNYIDDRLSELRQEDPQAEYTVDDIPDGTLKKYMGGYIFSEKLMRKDLTKEGEVYTAVNGEKRRLSLEPVEEYESNLSSPPEYIFYTYKEGDEWDSWDNIIDDDPILVRTSNIETTNGIVHVLQGNYTLFNYQTN